MGLFMVFTLSFLTTRQTHPLAAFFHGNNKPQNVLFCFFVCLFVCYSIILFPVMFLFSWIVSNLLFGSTSCLAVAS